ncbi:unnamed protein product [Scytosiphon promiscuus]
MSEHGREGNSQLLQDIETRLHSKLEEMVESKLEIKLEGLVESVASLLQAIKLEGLGSAKHGDSGGVSAGGASVRGVAAGGAAEEAASTGDGRRDAASARTPTPSGGEAEGTVPAMGQEGSGEARISYPQGEAAAGGPGGGLGAGLRGGLGGQGRPGLAGPACGRENFFPSFEVTPPQFKGGTDEYPAFREDFLQAARMADIDGQFVGRRVRPVPVGEAGKSRYTLSTEGFSAEEISASFYAWQFLDGALQQARDRDMLRRSTSPKDAFANLDAFYNLHTWDTVQDQFEQFSRFAITSKDNPLEKLSELEVLAYRLRVKGVAIDSRLLSTRFLSALPSKYEHAKLTLLSSENLQLSDIIRVVGAHHWYFSRRNDNQPHFSYALTAAGDGAQQRARNGGKRGGRNRRKGDRKQGESGHSAGRGSTSGERTGSDGRRCHRCGRMGHIRPDCTTPESDLPAVCENCDGFGHTSDVCTSEVEEVTLAVMLD